jgi:metal-dependent hydrolase (beta-lactamase superfamily II)
MLSFHILNVEHGLSVVVEYEADGRRHFGVIDSNAPAGAEPKALTKLRTLGAESLSFVALTHPHWDHFAGLFSVIKQFGDEISAFYSFPMGDLLTNRKRLRAMATKLNRLVKTDSPEIRHSALELIQIIKWADDSKTKTHWYECAGDLNSIAPFGFKGLQRNVPLSTPERSWVPALTARWKDGDG